MQLWRSTLAFPLMGMSSLFKSVRLQTRGASMQHFNTAGMLTAPVWDQQVERSAKQGIGVSGHSSWLVDSALFTPARSSLNSVYLFPFPAAWFCLVWSSDALTLAEEDFLKATVASSKHSPALVIAEGKEKKKKTHTHAHIQEKDVKLSCLVPGSVLDRFHFFLSATQTEGGRQWKKGKCIC